MVGMLKPAGFIVFVYHPNCKLPKIKNSCQCHPKMSFFHPLCIQSTNICYQKSPKIKKDSQIRTERSNFGFVWIGCKSEKERGIDRIKRSVLKNSHEEGGLNITDIDCLNRSLKLRQFMRANRVNHPIRTIQKYCMKKLGYTSTVVQEYDKLRSKGSD